MVREATWESGLCRALIGRVADPVFIVGKQGLVFANEMFARLVGRTESELLGRPLEEVVAPEDRHRIAALYGRESADHTAEEEFRLLHADGHTRIPILLTTDLWDRDGEAHGFIGTLVDATGPRHAERMPRNMEDTANARTRAESGRSTRGYLDADSRFRDLVEMTSDWVWEVDAHMRYTYASPKVRDLIGYEPCEIIGKTPFDLMAPDEAERVRHLVAPIAARRDPLCQVVNANLHRDGRPVILETSGVPIVDHTGAFRGYRGIDRDITEREKASAALQESRERYELAMQGAHEVIWDWQTDRDVLHLSPRIRDVLGVDADAVARPEDWLTVIHPEDRAAYEEALAAHLAGRTDVFDFEYRIVTASGAIRWVHHRGTALRNSGGRPYRMAGSIGDITGRKAVEERDRRQRQIIDLLNDIATVAIRTPRAEDVMRYCLTRICQHEHWPIGHVYLRSPEQPQTLVPSDLWHLEEPNRFAEWDRVTRNTCFNDRMGLPGRVADLRRALWIPDVRKEEWFLRAGVARDVGILTGFAFPVLMDDEVPAVFEFFSTERIEPDETLYRTLEHVGMQIGRVIEREQAARETEAARYLAEAASRAKSDFLASMSHELRTPLNAIIGFSDIIRREIFGPLPNRRYAEYVDSIHESGEHLLSMINDILDISAIESGRLEIHEAPVDVPRLVNAVVRLLQPHADKKAIALDVALPADVPPVLADERRLKQVLLNVLTNAIKFTPEGGAVHVAVSRMANDRLCVAVQDTGIGMDEEELEKALTPFGQIDNIMTRSQEGSGLGLPLTKSLIDLMGGTLAIESRPGAGTTVTIILPPPRVPDEPGNPNTGKNWSG